jgi:Protein of unknown function (DUF3631)
MPRYREVHNYAPHMEATARRLLGEPNTSLSKSTELRFGTHGSMAVDLKNGIFFDHENQVGGGVLDLVVRVNGGTHVDAVQWLRQEGILPKTDDRKGRAKPERVTVAEFEYQDEAGDAGFVVERQESRTPDGGGKCDKTFVQKRPDPERPGEWIYDKKGCRVIPYRLPELVEAVANEQLILIVEGEAKVDLLRSMGVNATCCAGGSGKWKSEHSEFLRGADVIVSPDNDPAGYKHLQEVGASLSGIARSIRVLMLPDLPMKGDVVDWVKAGGTREQLDSLIEAAPPWVSADPKEVAKSAAKGREDELINKLAGMEPGIERHRSLKGLAEELKVNVRALEAEIQRRLEANVVPIYGHWEVEPWPEPVEGDSLLRDIIRKYKRHVVFLQPDDDPLAIALWIMRCWVHEECAIHSPLLIITSAEPESGKSATLSISSFLMPRCIATVEITDAAMYRSIKKWNPSWAIDEFDDVLANNDRKTLRSIINSGHTRHGGTIIRCNEDKCHTPEPFEVFSPKALGMNGRKMPPATASRAIFIEQRRRISGEAIEEWRYADDPELNDLRQRLRKWALDNADALTEAQPKVAMPDGFINRRADNWRLQFAIADLCGDDWGEKARETALKLDKASDIASLGVRLLADIKRIFDETGADCIRSVTLVEKLKADEEAPWAEYNYGKGLTANSLAAILGGGGGRSRGKRGGFGIYSDTVHPKDEKHGSGYKRTQFTDAWLRYLPGNVGPQSDE